jgi:hypothetical protein
MHQAKPMGIGYQLQPSIRLMALEMGLLFIKVGPWFVDLNLWNKFINPLRDRKVESTVLDCLEKLQSRQGV